jgi:hypothetical protein
MKRVFALIHKPTFLSTKADALIGLFENEDDAKEALERDKWSLRKPFIQSIEVIESNEWIKRKKALDNHPDAPSGYLESRHSTGFGGGSYGPGTARGRR